MILTDHDIASRIESGAIGYEPFDYRFLNPASVDMTLHPTLRIPKCNLDGASEDHEEIDMREVRPGHTELAEMHSGGYRLMPGRFLLACTNESVRLPDNIVARVEGKSSIGRVGLAVHITAGFIDPGFEGQITLEVANLSPWPIRLHEGMRIGQIAFQETLSRASKPYGKVGHYMNQQGPTESRYKMEQ